MRKAAYAIAALVVVLALVIVIVPRLVSLESLRPRAVALLEEKTGRRVGLGRISLSLFPALGVRVTDVSVSGDARHAGEKLLQVPEAEVRLAILPLFSGRAELTRVLLRRPKVLFRRYADGTHSATDILARLGEPEKPPAAGPAPPKAGFAVAVDSLRIEDAALSFRTEGKDGKETTWDVDPLTVKVSGIERTKKEFRLETRIDGAVRGQIVFEGRAAPLSGKEAPPGAYEVKGDGKVFGQKLFLEGKARDREGTTELDLDLRMPKVELKELAGIFRDPPPVLAAMKPEGDAVLKARVAGTPGSLGFDASADLTRAGVSLYGAVRKPADVPCTIALQGRRLPDRLVIPKAELRMPSLLLEANGAVGPGEGRLEWAAATRIASLADLAKVLGVAASHSPAGRVAASGKGGRAGPAAAPSYAVGVELVDVGFRIPDRKLDIRGVNGRVGLSPAAVAFAPLAGRLDDRPFSLKGSVALGGAPPGTLDLRMAYLDVDALIPPAEGKKKEEGTKEPEPAGKKGEIAARIALVIEAGKARGIEFSDLRGTVRYEKEALFLDDVTAKLYGGSAAVSGRIGLSGASPGFRVKAALKEVAAGEILSRKTALKDFLVGPVSLSAEVGGGTKDFADFSRTATGSGSLRIAGGRIRGVDLLGTAAGLSGLSHLLPGAAAAPGKEARGETAFRELSADFRIGDGKIRTEGLKIVSDRLGLEGAASVGFDRTIDFRGILTLPKERAERVRGSAAKFLVGPGGRVEIPLVMKGPVNSPSVALDAQALARGAAERAVRGLKEKIPGLSPAPEKAGPGETPPPTGRGERKKRVEELIDRFLPKK